MRGREKKNGERDGKQHHKGGQLDWEHSLKDQLHTSHMTDVPMETRTERLEVENYR